MQLRKNVLIHIVEIIWEGDDCDNHRTLLSIPVHEVVDGNDACNLAQASIERLSDCVGVLDVEVQTVFAMDAKLDR